MEAWQDQSIFAPNPGPRVRERGNEYLGRTLAQTLDETGCAFSPGESVIAVSRTYRLVACYPQPTHVRPSHLYGWILPLQQKFACPVQTLHDLSVRLSNRSGNAPVHADLRLLDDQSNTVLASRSTDLTDKGEAWVLLQLPQPLNSCYNQSLRLEITTPAGERKNAPIAFSVPLLYSGTLEQAGKVIPDSSLAMKLNTGYYEIYTGER